MANLETLELTISANADSAVASIDNLATHLAALSSVIQAPLEKLTALNAQLQILKGYANLTLPNLGGGKTRGGMINPMGTPISQDEAMGMINAKEVDLLNQKGQAMVATYIQNATAGRLNNQQLAEGALQIRNVTNKIEKLSEETEQSTPKMSKFGQTLSQIGRIAKTMLIRTAIRSIIKGFTDAWNSAYEFSKKMGGDFAKNIDSIKASLKGAAVSIVSAFAPAMAVLAPVINIVANAIKFLCDAIQNLLSLIGIGSELFGASVDAISKAGSKGSGSAKNILASFDELNVLSQDSGGGSGKGSSSTGVFSTQITDELAKLQVVIGESMIAIGLILAFSGHVPLGVGMIAIGAAAIVKTVTKDWGKLTQDTKDEIAAIMSIAGGAFLGIGLILAFSGQVGIGIAMMAVGAANLVGVSAISDTLSPEIKNKISRIASIVGGALLAVGAILCLTGVSIPIGLGLMAAGAASLGYGVSINLNAISQKVQEAFSAVTDWLVNAWESVKTAVSNAWDKVKEWWTTNVYTKVVNGWAKTRQYLYDAWQTVKGSVANTWEKLKEWWTTNFYSKISTAWSNAKQYVCNMWTSIRSYIANTWDKLKDWWTTNFYAKISGAWANATNFLKNGWNDIKTNIGNAWNKVSDWWTTNVYSKISGAWKNAKDYLSNAWSTIKTSATNAWDKVKEWWTTSGLKGKVVNAWSAARQYLYDAWESIKNSAVNSWNKVKEWWTTSGLQEKVTSAWKGAKSYLGGVWEDIKTKASNAWAAISSWWNTGKNGALDLIRNAWNGLVGWFKTNITDPIADAFHSAINTIKYYINIVIRAFNSVGNFSIPRVGFSVPAAIAKLLGLSSSYVQIIPQLDISLWKIRELPIYGNGGFPDVGDLFIANEQGAELVGSMGGRTTVANNQQIIEGIANGVEAANEKQNALLRRQNELLTAILQKTGNGFDASSALGRVVSRSLEMYGNMIGG